MVIVPVPVGSNLVASGHLNRKQVHWHGSIGQVDVMVYKLTPGIDESGQVTVAEDTVFRADRKFVAQHARVGRFSPDGLAIPSA